MILEAAQYAATCPITPKAFRPFVRSSVSLWSRARRCSAQWAPHEANCKTVIRETVEGMKQRRTAVVLGSGLLRDVPIEFLARSFDTVVLVDLVHLATVRPWLSARRLSNTRLIWRDISGLDGISTGEPLEPLAFLRQVPFLDLVVSANVLSQIGVGAVRQLARDGRPEQPKILRSMIQAHLDGLQMLPCKVVLITDTSYTVTDGQGRVTEEADLMHGVATPPASRNWSWTVAPFGELSRNSQAVHQVIATRFPSG